MEGPKSISLLNHVSRLGFGSVSHQAHLVWRPDLHDSLRLGTFFFEAAISTTLPCTREGRDAMHANAPMPWLDRIPFRLAPPPMAMWTDEVQLVMLPSSSSSWWPYRRGRLKLGTRLSHWPIIAPTIRAEQKEASLPISVADGTVQFDWHLPALEGLVFLPSLIRFFWPRGEATLVARPLLSSLALGPPIAVLSIEGASKELAGRRRWGRRELRRCSRRSTTRGAPAALTTGGRTSSGECRTRSSSMSGWFLSRPVQSSLPLPRSFWTLSPDFSLELVTLENLDDRHLLQ